jgi:hypothetical protein
VKAQPEIAKFKFNVSNCWLGGAHNRSTVNGFRGAMQDNEHTSRFVMDAGEHPVLLGNDDGATGAPSISGFSDRKIETLSAF